MTTPTDREMAAQLWCLPQHSAKVMDVDFAESIAAAIARARAEGARQEREAIRGWTVELDGSGDDADTDDIRAWLDARDKAEGK